MKIETERLTIRKINLSDIEEYFRLINTEFVLKYNCIKPKSLEKTADYLLNESDKGNVYAIILKSSNKMIGEIDIEDDSLRSRVESKELSYWLGEEYSRKGYMTEALTATINYLFAECEILSITSRVFSQNLPSLNLLKKLGFQVEGILSEAVKGYRDIIYDDVLLNLNRRDWASGI